MIEEKCKGVTTPEVRLAIRNSTDSIRNLARRYGINPKTVAKWKKRANPNDAVIDRRNACSTSLTLEEENMVISFRRHSMLPLDDCLYALQISIPHLTRSSLHRCLKRNGISRIPNIGFGGMANNRCFPRQIGVFVISLTELRTARGNLYLYAATDQCSKFTFAQVVQQPDDSAAVSFLDALAAAIPYKIHIVLTSNHVQSTFPIRYDKASIAYFSTPRFDQRCAHHGIDHQVYQAEESWLNQGPAGVRPPQDSIDHFAYGNQADLELYLSHFLTSFNYTRRLKCLRGLAPYRFICKIWEAQPDLFLADPYHANVGPIRHGKTPMQRAIR